MDDSACLIATAAHGTELAPQVQALCGDGDGTLLATGSGSAFMSAFSAAYYSFSPHVADLEREYPAFRQAAAAAIAPMLHALHVEALADPSSEESVVLHGIAALLLVMGLYVGLPRPERPSPPEPCAGAGLRQSAHAAAIPNISRPLP